MLVNREVILAKIESTYDTDPTPTGADDAILVEQPSWSNEGLRMVDRPVVRSEIGTVQQVFAGMLKQITFDAELKGPGSAYSASNLPEIDPLLRACGFAATVDTTPSSENVVYEPVSTNFESVTIYYYQDGLLQKITGCRGNVSFNLSVGGIPKATFTMTGHPAVVTDTAIVTPTYLSTVPPAVIGGAFTVDSYAAVIEALTLDMANTVATPPDFNDANGYSAIYITKRDPNGSFNPEAVLVATEAFDANFRGGSSMALTTGAIGGNQYNQVQFDMPAIYYRSMGPGDRDGVRVYDMGYGAASSSGDDEVSITFT